MNKRRRRLFSLLTALFMLFSLMSGFPAFAEGEPGEEMYYGLKIGSPFWNEDKQKQEFDVEAMGSYLFCEAGYHFDFTIGWRGQDGEIAPLTEADLQSVVVKDSNGDPVDVGIAPTMYGYPDEGTGRWEEAPAGDGIFRCCFRQPGEYTVTYSGEPQGGEYPSGAIVQDTVMVDVHMPVVALYQDEEINAGSLLGDEVTYMPGATYFILAEPLLDEGDYKTETEIKEIQIDDHLKQYVTLEEITAGEIYKLTISKRMDFSSSICVKYEQDDYKKNGSGNFECIREAQNEFWINLNEPLHLGFVADWTQWDDEDPDKPVVKIEGMRGNIEGYEIKARNTFTFGWKSSEENVDLIPISDLDKFTAYDENGDKVTEDWIWPATHWNDEAEQEEERGDGYFNICFNKLGIYRIVYDAGEQGPNAILGAFWGDELYIEAVMPDASIYSDETVSQETLLGSRVEYKDGVRTFYANVNNVITDTFKKECRLTGYEMQSPGDADGKVNITENGEKGYKIEISEDFTDQFNIRLFISIKQSRKENDEWIDDGEWDRDYWVDFNHWEPEYYGLGSAWPWHEGENLPEFPDELYNGMGMEAKADRTLCFGWTDAEGNITPIPLADISKFHLYDPDGNEVTGDWIRYPKRWNEGEEVDLGIEGMFEVTFPSTGTYVVKYDKDISGEEAPEGMAVTNECTFNVEFPDVGIYSKNTKSDETLIGEHVEFKNANRVFYVISANHEDNENIFTRTIKSYKVVMPYGFEDKADDTVTIQKVNDHTLKVTVAEDTELGFDLELEILSTNKNYDHGTGTWVDNEGTWTDMRMLNFWPKEIVHYGLVAGFPAPVGEGGPLGNMQQYLDGFFETYDQALVFAWRDSKGNETQIRADDFTTCFTLKDEKGNEVPFGIEKQENDDYIYDVWFLRRGLFYLYYDGDLVVDEGVEDTVCQNRIKIWVDPPFLGVYSDENFSDETLLGRSIEYEPDKLVYYLAGMSVGDERGSMKSYVTSVDVVGAENPDFVTITKNEDGTAKVEITKLPDQDYDGQFTLTVNYRIDSVWYDEQGEVTREENDDRTEDVCFLPGEGFKTGNISVNFKTKGATPAAPQIYIYNRGSSRYYDLSGNEQPEENKWVTVTPGTFMIENLPLGCYNVVEKEAAAAVKGYDLVKSQSVLLAESVMVEEETTALVELKNVYKAKKVVYPYKNEWRNGVWYNADGTQTYKAKGSWKHNSKGYWFGDTSGWYAKKCWQKIDGKDYYFDAKGYMVVDEYIDGYYLTKTGAWDGKGKAQWKGSAKKGWWYSLPNGTYLKNCWAKIDGKYYYFKANGYAAMNEFVQGWWFGRNCAWNDPVHYDWHESQNGRWYGVNGGWYARNKSYIIDGKTYTFDKKGYMK